MKLLLTFLLLATSAFAIEDDNDPTTGRARFSWVQDPSASIVTQYKVTVWEDGKTPAEAMTATVLSPPQTEPTTPCSLIMDGFKEGTKYHAYVQAQGKVAEEYPLEDSDPSETITFTYSTKIPTPKLPKVEIQVSGTLDQWRTVAMIPLTETDRFVRARIASQ